MYIYVFVAIVSGNYQHRWWPCTIRLRSCQQSRVRGGLVWWCWWSFVGEWWVSWREETKTGMQLVRADFRHSFTDCFCVFVFSLVLFSPLVVVVVAVVVVVVAVMVVVTVVEVPVVVFVVIVVAVVVVGVDVVVAAVVVVV